MNKTTTLVFVHGFQGNEATFNAMPHELLQLLQPCFPDRTLESKVFVYESKGSRTAELLYDFISDLQSNEVHIVSHSMGGIFALDCARLYGTDKKMAPLLKLKSVISIDTPFWDLSHGDVFKSVSDPVRQIASGVSSSAGWGGLFAAAGIAAVATVALAHSSRSKSLQDGIASLGEKFKNELSSYSDFLQPLLQEKDTRFSVLWEQPDFMFAGIYLKLKDGSTFTKPPPQNLANHFQVLPMNAHTSVIDAHMHMFSSEKDPDAYSELLIMVMQRLKDTISQSS